MVKEDRFIKVGNKVISRKGPVFLIAEAGINHNGDFEIAKKLIEKAAACGADAIKFQSYITEKRVPKDSPIFDILKKCELPFEKQEKLKKFADDLGIIFFSTPFDEESVDFLMSIGISLLKVASFDITNNKLLGKLDSTKVPLIISRGMANKDEIDAAIELINNPFALLHCISAYPTPEEAANLNVIKTMLEIYDCPIGYSDHTIGVRVPVYAVAAGAQIIEKHFTLDINMEGPDHKISADPSTLKEMVNSIGQISKVLGEDELKTYDIEKGTLTFRRS